MEENGNSGKAFNDSIKSLWKKLPFSIKMSIIGGLAAFLLLLIIGGSIVAMSPSIFLDYSDAVSDSNVEDEYEKYWANLCEEGDPSCSEEQILAAQELRDSQQNFYDKLDSLVYNYNISPTQKYIVLMTLFYNYDIDSFTAENGAFLLDSTDEIDYEVDENDYDQEKNIYIREEDSLKELIKQFRIEAAYCEYTFSTESGEPVTEEYPLEGYSGKYYNLNFFDKVQMKLGINPFDEAYESAKSFCEESRGGRITTKVTTDTEVSIEAYYDYLRESTYFDDKPHLDSLYAEYARENGITDDKSTWKEEDREAVREEIIADIRAIVDEYVERNGLELEVSTGTRYWYPIGSESTTVVDGKTYASGDPQFIGINSNFGYRIHPVKKVLRLHDGIDLKGPYNTNIIAAIGGTVVNIENSCNSYSSNGCGKGYGNYVEILDVKGNINLYAHMFQNSIKVTVGEIVSQGQLLGETGNSGTSTGAHLHFTIKVNGSAVDPLDYIDPNNPRPSSYGDIDFNSTSYSKEEFVSKLKEYYKEDLVCNSSSSQYVNGCTSFKNEILNNDGAETIYDVATSKNLNPELVVARSALEGYSPGVGYNYFGYSCNNEGGLAACSRFTSFKAAMEAFFSNISKYDSVETMMSKYAYIGSYWYTGTHWDWGGCAYASYIYPDAVPNRVQEACARPDGYCSMSNTSKCVATTQADQDAYTRWQVSKMAEARDKVFG